MAATMRPDSRRLLSRIPALLSELLAVPEEDIAVEVEDGRGPDRGFDVLVSAVGHTFVVQLQGASSPGLLAPSAERAVAAAKAIRKRAIPVLAVPFMSPAGKQACARAGVSWFDFSGNAHITAPGLRIIVGGRPDRFPKLGRPASVFSPKSSRVVRWLLIHPGEAATQRELAKLTDVSEGLVSRIASRLEEQHYLARSKRGSLHVTNPQLLLEAWQDEYRFSKHTVIQGHVAARSGDALTRFVGDALSAASIEHAATGLSAAWQLTRFVGFRVATFFMSPTLDEGLTKKLGFREDPRGANLWLVLPNDHGVFQGAEDRDGVRCVHPVQAYLDLKEHPERASEAAERIRTELLRW